MSLESCTRKELCKASGGSEKLLDELRTKLEDWLKLQLHLPQDIPMNQLDWFLLYAELSLEKAKHKLDMYYTTRRLAPEIYSNRNPHEPLLKSVHEGMQYVVLPKLTPEKYRTNILRLRNTNDVDTNYPWEIVKYVSMVADIQMNESCLSCGQNFILDLSELNIIHVLRITPTMIKKCEFFISKACGPRVIRWHVINAPSFIDRLHAMIKSLVKPKLMARVHIHSAGNLESFHRFVPKSVLPKDYGGNQQTMDELSDVWRAKVDEWQDWFLRQETIVVDERLRPGPAIDKNNFFGVCGSFRNFEVD